jgi:hypothetical protein
MTSVARIPKTGINDVFRGISAGCGILLLGLSALWVGKHGVNVAKFTAAFRSFGVNTSEAQAEQKSVDYRIPGVPTLAIDGKYTVDGDQEKMLATSDQLIAMERVANKKAGK